MAFNGINMTPIGGNSRSGEDTDINAPMGWAYSSEVDSVADVQFTGYFDTFNKLLAADQFIYSALADENVIFTVKSVDRDLQQVQLATQVIRPQAPDPFNVTEVFVESDFEGTVMGDTIEIQDPQKFLLMDAVVLEKGLTCPVTSDPSIISFQSTFFGSNDLLFVGPGTPTTFITCPFTFIIHFNNILTFDFSNGFEPLFNKGIHTFMNLDGIEPGAGSFLLCELGDVVNFKSVGTIKNFDDLSFITGLFLNAGGLSVENIGDITFQNFFFGNVETSNEDIFLSIAGEVKTLGTLNNVSFDVGAGEAAIFIDPNIGAESSFNLTGIRVDITGNGEFFKSGVTGAITLWADNTSTGSVTVVTDNLDGTATVTTNAAHGLEPFQEAVLSAMTESSYDGTFLIISTPTTTTFIIKLDASPGTATGTWTSNSVTVTSAAHGQLDGQTLLVTETIDYNGGAKIYNAQTNTYEINRTFVSAETAGKWDTGSLTQTDNRVQTIAVDGVPDSKTIFSLSIDALTSPLTQTIGAADVYQDLDLSGGTILLNGTETFSLVDSDAGTFRCDTLEPKTIKLGGFISAAKSGSSQRQYAFVPFISTDGGMSFVQLTDVAQSTISFTNGIVSVSLGGAIVMNPGDQIKLRAKTIGHTIAFDISTIDWTGD